LKRTLGVVTQRLADFVVSTDADALPDWAIHEAKRTLINMLAISLSASKADGARIMLEWVADEAAAEQASVIGATVRTSPGIAALANGFLCHLQDYDDTHFPTILHPTAPVWPAVLALAIGLIFGHAPLRGSCGGLACGGACRTCPRRNEVS